MEKLIVSADVYMNNFIKNGAEKISENVYKINKGGFKIYCIRDGSAIIEIECMGSSIVYSYVGV